MKKTIFYALTLCLMGALSFTSCSDKASEPTRTSLTGPGTPKQPNMDTKNTTTTEMKKSNAKTNQTGGLVIDGCQEKATAQKGTSVQILLPAVAGTGYLWTLAKVPTLLSQVNKDNVKYKDEPKTDPMMVGASQKQILDFTANNAGTETLDLIYIRPFEKNKIEKRCSITITVE